MQIAESMRGLAGPDKVVIQRQLGQAAVTQAQLGVRRGLDPYGKTWAPLTSRTGQPLRRTGNNIQRSWTAGGETPDTFKFGSRFKYLATHQYGAVIRPKNGKALRWKQDGPTLKSFGGVKRGQATQMNRVYAQKVTIPRRQLVPEQDTGGLGERWFGAFKRVIRSYLEIKFYTGTGG